MLARCISATETGSLPPCGGGLGRGVYKRGVRGWLPHPRPLPARAGLSREKSRDPQRTLAAGASCACGVLRLRNAKVGADAFLPRPACGERSKSARATRGFRVRGRVLMGGLGEKQSSASMIQGPATIFSRTPPMRRRPLTRLAREHARMPNSPSRRGEVRTSPRRFPGTALPQEGRGKNKLIKRASAGASSAHGEPIIGSAAGAGVHRCFETHECPCSHGAVDNRWITHPKSD